MQHPDVVIVGAGIAGGALAAVLAENGCKSGSSPPPNATVGELEQVLIL
jgi:flavin-dependent dehydrogenase